MQAIILAGGKGTRLRPYTTFFPKPLVPVGDFPILEIVIRQLKRHGFNDIVISTGHLAELIEAYFGNGNRWDVQIEYVREETPLNTAGALGLVDNLKRDFLVMNGDILTNVNYTSLFNSHLEKKGIATLGVHERKTKIDFGVIEITPEYELKNYIEKPSHSLLVSMGINVLNIRCKDYIKNGESISMPDLLLRMKSQNEKIFCYKEDCYWLDIGRPDDYQIAQEKFENSKGEFIQNEQ